VRKLGEYIGFFEFVVAALSKQVEVLVLFGEHIINVVDAFASDLKPCTSGWPVARIAAVVGARTWLSVEAEDGSYRAPGHFVIGQACEGGVIRPSPGALTSSAVRAAMKVNWHLRPTDLRGDCGIDALCYHLGYPRHRAVFEQFRRELADFMVLNADDARWHNVFRQCGEMDSAPRPLPAALGPPPKPVALWGAPSASSSSASASASCPSAASCQPEGVASPPGVPPPLPPPRVGPSSEDQVLEDAPPEAACPSAASCQPEGVASPPGVPPPLSPPRVGPSSEDLVLEDAPPEAARQARPPVQVGGGGRFAEWLKAMSTDELTRATASPEAFRDAEQAWRTRLQLPKPEGKPRAMKQRCPHALHYRLALGTSFLRWRAVEGRASSTALKDRASCQPLVCKRAFYQRGEP